MVGNSSTSLARNSLHKEWVAVNKLKKVTLVEYLKENYLFTEEETSQKTLKELKSMAATYLQIKSEALEAKFREELGEMDFEIIGEITSVVCKANT